MKLRTWRAFLIAPMTAPVGYWLEMLIEAALDPARRPFVVRGGLTGLAVSILIGGPIAYGATAIAGTPLWLLAREGVVRGSMVIAVGTIAGMATALILAPSLTAELFSIPLGVWRGGALGALTAAVWWHLLQPETNRRAIDERT